VAVGGRRGARGMARQHGACIMANEEDCKFGGASDQTTWRMHYGK